MGNYLIYQGELSYYQDHISQVILFNNVKVERVLAFCDLMEKLSIHLQEKNLSLHRDKAEHCKKNKENEEDCLCNSFDSAVKKCYDEVDEWWNG